ncbi:hypothetical protein Tco_0226424 [Tanacetum coccineum]
MNQTQKANNSIKNDNLAALFGKYKYEEGLIDQIYESEISRFYIQTSSSKTLISNTHLHDSNSDVKEDTRNNSEFLADLNAVFHDRALLANQKGFYKRSGRVRSAKKPIDKSNETCFACGKLGIKVKIVILTKKIDAMSKGKSEKGLVAELFDWDDESVSSGDKGITKVKAFMAIAEDEPSVGKVDARSDESPSETAPEITSDSESECDYQDPLPPFPKFSGAEPNGTSNDVISLADLTLALAISENTKKVLPKCEYYPGCEICGSIAHEIADYTKKTSLNNRKPRIAS